MVDWGLVAVVIALLAYPLQAIAVQPLFKFFERACGWLYRQFQPSAGQCITFDSMRDFPNTSLHSSNHGIMPCYEPACTSPSDAVQRLSCGSWEQGLSTLFPAPWRRAAAGLKVPKPYQLPATKRYIRADPEVVLLYAYFSALCQNCDKAKFEDFVQLREQNGILLARICFANGKHFHYERAYLDVFRKLCATTRSEIQTLLLKDDGGYERLLNLNANRAEVKKINHPIRKSDDWRRGGWVLALGMSDISYPKGPPFPTPILREEPVESSFYKERGKRMMLPQGVENALRRVISTLEDLRPNFPDHRHLGSALEMTKEFREDASKYLLRYTGLRIALRNSPLFGKDYRRQEIWKGGEMHSISSQDCGFVVDIFNRYQKLENDERERFAPILEDACRAAIIGMIRVFHFYEYGSVVVKPALLRKHEYVYLEDSL
ncbi:hypothetical protein F5X97DRAFT_310516 [Nemania serpens]|nr:hypothetical protein F5X97DRAFT_310516 [Nemania serpens]